MAIEFRLPTPADIPVHASWLEARGKALPDPSWLPQVGGVITMDGEPQSMGYLYVDGSVGVAHFDWLATRPGLTPGEAVVFIDRLLCGMEHVAKNLFPGRIAVIGCVQSKAMAKRAEKLGFTPLGETHLILKCPEP